MHDEETELAELRLKLRKAQLRQHLLELTTQADMARITGVLSQLSLLAVAAADALSDTEYGLLAQELRAAAARITEEFSGS